MAKPIKSSASNSVNSGNVYKSLFDLGNEQRGLNYSIKPLTPQQNKLKIKLKQVQYA